MSYDHWKATAPPDDTPWQECAACHRRDALSRMWRVGGEWFCEDCCAEANEDDLGWEDDPCEAAS